jgi:Ca2+-transporting ATPase
MAIIGIAIFLLVWAVYFWRTQDLLNSLLKGLTLAMSILRRNQLLSPLLWLWDPGDYMKEGYHCKKNQNSGNPRKCDDYLHRQTGTITKTK